MAIAATRRARYVAVMRLFVLLMLLFAGVVHAEVYRWTDANGVVHYTDKPPDKQAKPVTLPALQTYQPDTVKDPLAQTDAPKKVTVPPPAAPRIVSPANETTLRDAQRTVDVEVNAALRPGEGLLYLLDGAPQNEQPTSNTSFVLQGVERGTHTLTVTTVDADGKPIATSAPVTIYMKPPTVHHP